MVIAMKYLDNTYLGNMAYSGTCDDTILLVMALK